MVEPEHLDDFGVVPEGSHMEGGGAHMVWGVWVGPIVQQPLDRLLTTHERQQVQKSASSHILILQGGEGDW